MEFKKVQDVLNDQELTDLNAILLKKSIWKPAARRHWDFFCPNCKYKRRIPMPRRPTSFRSVIQISLTSLVCAMALSSWLSFKGLVVFVPIWAIYEMFYRLKVRALMPCPQCGFDPYLYCVDKQLARKEIDQFWRAKFAEKNIPYPGESLDKNEALQQNEKPDNTNLASDKTRES